MSCFYNYKGTEYESKEDLAEAISADLQKPAVESFDLAGEEQSGRKW